MRFILPTIFGAAAACLAVFPGMGAPTNELSDLMQVPIIRSWGTEAGLPQNTVNAIVQTRDGYMWVATHDGLARFDGVRFQVFGLEQGLPGVDINQLYVDNEDVLWIGTYGAGLCFMRPGGRIERVANPSGQPGNDTIDCLQKDAAGRLWVGTDGGLRFFEAGKLVTGEPALAPFLHTPISFLQPARDGSMWISTTTYGLHHYVHGRLELCQGIAVQPKVISRSMFEDRQRRLWVSIGNGYVLCRTNDQWQVFSQADGLPFPYISSITQDAEGTIWAGSLDDGLYRFDGKRFQALHVKDGLSAEDVRSLHCDTENNLWVGTRTGGLNRLSRRNLLAVAGAQGLTNDFTRAVAETADGSLWVGTWGGSVYRGNLTHFGPFRPDPVGQTIYYWTTQVNPMLVTPDDTLWWGGNNALFAWKDNQLTHTFTNESWQSGILITALQNDRHGGIWIGSNRGQLVHYRDGQFKEFPRPVARSAISSLAVEPDGAVWVGSVAGGLKLIREESDTVLSLTNGLDDISVRTLYLDADDTLWIGTAGGGLSCWSAGQYTKFSPKQGLTLHTVSQIVEDNNGNLWLGCSSGIYKVSKRSLLACAAGRMPFVHTRSYGVNDGMLTEECSGGFCPAGLKLKSGLICISTVKGLVFIDPNGQRHETPPPRALLEELLVNNQPQPLAAGPAMDQATGEKPARAPVVIAAGPRDIELHYTAIEFTVPEKIGFRYQLEGYDSGWQEALSRRQANYHHVPPGIYTFHVQACNAAGDWSGDDTTLTLVALPFIWERKGFQVAGMLALFGFCSGLLWLGLRRRYRLRLARLQMMNAIERERLRISKDMHDHVGGVLTQVSQLSDMSLNETDDRSLVRDRFERIGDRARVAVQALDEIVWATNPKNDNLASFAEYVSRFSDEFFEYTRIRCWQEVPTSLPALPLRADVRHNVFLSVREAFNNALKHSKCTEVWLRMKLDEGEVTLEVDDNGCGFSPGQGAGGNGLENMRARLAEDGGRTVFISTPGKGTRVRFIFPVSS